MHKHAIELASTGVLPYDPYALAKASCGARNPLIAIGHACAGKHVTFLSFWPGGGVICPSLAAKKRRAVFFAISGYEPPATGPFGAGWLRSSQGGLTMRRKTQFLCLKIIVLIIFCVILPSSSKADCAPYSESLPSVGYASSTGKLMACDGTNWITPQTTTPWSISNTDIYYNSGVVSVGTNSPEADALLDLSSTTKGFLPPRMTTAQRDAIASPPAGLMIYNISSSVPQFWSGTAWVNMGGVAQNKDFFSDNSLVAAYFFEDNLNDANGVYNGTATDISYVSGKHNRAGYFNGSSSKFVSSTNIPISGASPRSLSAWVKLISNTQDAAEILAFGVATSGNNFGLVPMIAATAQWGLWGYGSDHDIGSAVTPTLGVWHHVVGTYDGTIMKLYLDGALIGSTAAALNTTSTTLRIGARASSAFTHGYIDTVRVFNRALTADEVLNLYNE